VFDDLTFTLATGDAEFRAPGIETIEGIRRIKRELPGVLTEPRRLERVVRALEGGARGAQLGVPLPLRAGRLDMAIVNAADIAALRRDRREDRGRPRT
jgi:5-methyltetrahydrofolate--homocysteine methyltransferase